MGTPASSARRAARSRAVVRIRSASAAARLIGSGQRLELLQVQVEDILGLGKDPGLGQPAPRLEQHVAQDRERSGGVEVGVLPKRGPHAGRLDCAEHRRTPSR